MEIRSKRAPIILVAALGVGFFQGCDIASFFELDQPGETTKPPTQEPTELDVSVLPEVAGSPLEPNLSKAVSLPPYSPTFWAEFESFGMMPMLTGWSSAPPGTKTGTSFRSTVFGSTVTTTIVKSGGNVVYRGLFDDGIGAYTVTMRPDKSFDYALNVIFQADMGGTTYTFLITSEMKDAQLNGTNFAGSGVVRFANYNTNPNASNEISAVTFDVKAKRDFCASVVKDKYTGSSYTFGEPAYDNTALYDALLALDSVTSQAWPFLVFRKDNQYYRVSGLPSDPQYWSEVEVNGALGAEAATMNPENLDGPAFVAGFFGSNFP